MRVFDMLKLLVPELEPKATKIHLAGWNGHDDPLDVFLAGRFPEWQSFQARRNFERAFVLSLIEMQATDRWLFAGLRRVEGACFRVPDPHPAKLGQECWRYPMSELAETTELSGRLVAAYTRDARNAYRDAEKLIDRITMAEVLPRRLSIGTFPGFRSVDLSFDELGLIVGQGFESWRSALSSVAGVYLISDTETGKLYVGSASGMGGFWSRWSSYATTGHGGNVELRALVNVQGLDRAKAFRFSVLEIADIHTGEADVIARECHWKRVLLSREHGLNGN